MTMRTMAALALLLSLFISAGCSRSSQEAAVADLNTDTVAQEAEQTAPATEAGSITGEVLETMNTAGYTYVLVDTGEESIWSAAPEVQVEVGDKVTVSAGMPMSDYHSATLGRTFETLYFSEAIRVEGRESGSGQPATSSGLPPGHPSIGNEGADSPQPDLSDIQKADGGMTIAEIHSEKSGLQGKEVAVRGRVTKYTANIMGKNWIHIQDGSGQAGTNDLTVTTTETAAVGDLVVVRGMVALDKDLGSGYFYPVIVENATVKVE